jgi:hypothetical protein
MTSGSSENSGETCLNSSTRSGSDYHCRRHESKNQNLGEQGLLHSVPNHSGHLPGLRLRHLACPLGCPLCGLLVYAATIVLGHCYPAFAPSTFDAACQRSNGAPRTPIVPCNITATHKNQRPKPNRPTGRWQHKYSGVPE